MKNSTKLLSKTVATLTCALALLAPALLPAQAFHPAVTKLHGRAPQAGHQFGRAVALSDRFLLVGEPYNDDNATNAGAAHLYDARSGRFLRTLYPKDPAANAYFGGAVALSGHLALIGSAVADVGGNNTAYVFDLSTGREQQKLTPNDGAPGDYFGGSVAIHGNTVLVGALRHNGGRGAAYLFDARTGAPAGPGKLVATVAPQADDLFGWSVALDGDLALIGVQWDDDGQNNSGSAYLFDTRSGTMLHRLTSDGIGEATNNGRFGYSVALNGGLALIGAVFNNGGTGAAYLFDARSGAFLRKLTATDAAADDQFGYSVALDGSLALISTTLDDDLGSSSGSAYLFDAQSGTQLGKLHAPDGAANDQFGYRVALSGGLALIGARYDDDHGNSSGSAYLFHPLASPLSHLYRAAAKGSFAPGAPGAAFSSFPSAYINPDGVVVLRANLSGPGAKQGVWNSLPGSSTLALRLKDSVGDYQINQISHAWSNRSTDAVILTRSTLNNYPGNKTTAFRHSAANLNAIGGSYLFDAIDRIHEVAQSGLDYLAGNAKLKPGNYAGIGAVNKTNDSAIASYTHAGGIFTAGPLRHEGVSVIPALQGGGTLGQLTNRIAIARNLSFIGFSGARLPPVAGPAKQAVYSASIIDENIFLMPALQGDEAYQAQPAAYRAFLGESMSPNGYLLWRASLSGEDVNRKNNEAIWHESNHILVARKGQEIDLDVVDPQNDPYGLHGLKIARFLQFWPTSNEQQALLLVKLSGPGVRAANDLALCLWDRNISYKLQILLREGQTVAGADAPAIKVIQRVDVDPVNGQYVVLCSLTGAAAKNQALLTGCTTLGNHNALKGLREPALKLRKGTLHTTAAGTTRLRSLTLSPSTDKTGAGGKGQGQVINHNGRVALTATFDNKAVEVLNGRP